ncbi:MAG: glutamate synthase, partial [Chloroflexota bacterium]
MNKNRLVNQFISSREKFKPAGGFQMPNGQTAEGGCGVIGMASSKQIAARHMLQSLIQMRNRGNGKGGGIAAVGLAPEEFGVTQKVLEEDYLLAVAYLDISVRKELEEKYIQSIFEVDHIHEQPQMADYKEITDLEVRPPDVVIYFVRLKDSAVQAFKKENKLEDAPRRKIEDEIVYQNTYALNNSSYDSHGEKQAFVLSHGKNLLVLKMVGYGDDVVRYYQLEDTHAHVWIGHHRYPTKGRVWHPGGAHPFIGMNEALVHNGDFANHASISEYIAQRNIYPLFLTDTEVAVQVFDLLHRTYDYPLEYTIEAIAPTTERDFAMLPEDKKHVYGMLQTTHMHASPDGPWFFLIAQSDTHADAGPEYRLTCITDTSMLRPQVFAWQESENADGEKMSIGFAASE